MMGHGDAMGFHGMTGPVVEVPDVGLVEVRDSLFGGGGSRHDSE